MNIDQIKKKLQGLVNPQGLPQNIARGVTQAAGFLAPQIKPLIQSRPAQQAIQSNVNLVKEGAQASMKLADPKRNVMRFQSPVFNPVQSMVQDMPDTLKAGKLAAAAYGLPQMTAASILTAGGLGGLFSKATGGSFSEGAGQGLSQAPILSGIGAVTNPAISSLAGRVAGNVASPLTKNLAQRVATGLMNIPEGVVMKGAITNNAYGAGDAITDFLLGAATGQNRQIIAKGSVAKKDYSRAIEKLQPNIRDLIVRFEKMAGQAYDPANPVVDLNIEDDARTIWKMIYGKNKSVPERLDRTVGEIVEAWQGWKTEMDMAQRGVMLGFADQKKVTPQEFTPSRDWQEVPLGSRVPIGGEFKMENGKQYARWNDPPNRPVENPSDPFYNVKRVGADDQAQRTMSELIRETDLGQKMKEPGGNPLTFKEVEAQARVSPTLNVTKTRENALKLGAEAKALRNKVAEYAQLGLTDDKYREALIKDKAFGQFIARLLGQRRMISNPDDVSIFNQMISKILKEGADIDEVAAAAKGVDFDNPQQAAEFYRKFIKTKTSDWLDLLRYNSMLSSPSTHINNAFSNFGGSAIIAPIEKTITGTLDFLASPFTKERKAFAGEGLAYAGGYGANVGNAAHKFADVLSGKAAETNLDTRGIPLATKGVGKGVYNVLNFPMKLLEATDQFFTTLSEGGERSALELRKSKGVNVGDIEKQVKEKAAYRLFRQEPGDKSQGYVLQAVDELTGLIQRARGSSNPITSTVAKYTLPFVRTPMNIFKQSVEYSPAGFMTIPGAKNKTEQLSKAILGTTAFAGASMLLASGRTTWAEPTGEKQKAAFRAAGMQPYSVKIGNQWVAYSKLPPALAANLALVSALHDAEESKTLNQSQTDAILEGVAKWGNFFADQSYVKQIGDLISATKGDAESFTRFFSNYPQQLVPYRALMGWITRIVDPYQRKIDTDGSLLEKQIQQLEMSIPGLSANVPMRLDNSGNPIENQNRLLNAFSPVRITNENPNARAEYEALRQDAILTKNINVLRDMVKKDGGVQRFGDTFVYLDPDTNETRAVDVSKLIERPQLTNDTETDKKLMRSYYSRLGSQRSAIKELNELGLLSDAEASSYASQYQGSGRSGSGRGRRFSIRLPKIKLLKASKTKAFKMPRMKKLKLAKSKFKKISLKTIKLDKRSSTT